MAEGMVPEPLPRKKSIIESYYSTLDNQSEVIDSSLFESVETKLKENIDSGDLLARFQLAQLYFEQGLFEEAFVRFARLDDVQSKYQLGVLYYDGLGIGSNPDRGVRLMKEISECTTDEAMEHVIRCAEYNVGLAYFEGYGVEEQSDDQSVDWWIKAANDGSPSGSVKAQTALGLFYSRRDRTDHKKAYFWHNEACGNGSLESQGAVGAHYYYGNGKPKNHEFAYQCWKEAAERGNIYAIGCLVMYYYHKKLFNRAAQLGHFITNLTVDDVPTLANKTGCVSGFVKKGLALANFYYGRCLHLGEGEVRDVEKAKLFYSKAISFDVDEVVEMQKMVQRGDI